MFLGTHAFSTPVSRDLMELFERGFEVFDDFLGGNVGIGKVLGVIEAFVSEAENVKAGFVAVENQPVLFCLPHKSVTPIRMGQRSGIQFVPTGSPMRQEIIHQRDKVVVMMALQQMNQFVDDNIFEALHRLLGKFEV